ncbi:glucose 1-dehydrogenase [Novosphingobium resinovorum]|uniref:Short-chain dehydrogenase/reductase SDR n=1 Tax=Novosphingobium resinovorum TaxID=158500 RepID=A0A031K665_9SPHN|nr:MULTISPECIES: glucose 1-dehydrogenase [Novosphingobium]EZP84740.1 Short-chain dehydrogenase/reductase SDR [Novosphingobium resinovorum]MBF7011105.1 glucose 1-dehydrogenase [Novosphingobium sp. HR1a]WJM29094.1 glucose 1-dehydrogenase [Novosphingobium resinovorum]
MQGKRVLITGASSGLGRHFAQVLSAAGAHVVLAARRMDALEELAAEIGDATCVSLDVTDPASIREAVLQAGPIDVLVNNAGVSSAQPVLDATVEDYDHIMSANLRGAFLVATEVARRMRDRGEGGAIVNIASILGLAQGGQLAVYAMSKAGVVQMTKQMALELARYGIRVNALAPGYFATDMNRDFLSSKLGEAMSKRIPQRRFGNFEDLDGPLMLLCSDASRYMTGVVIPVDGGHLLGGL